MVVKANDKILLKNLKKQVRLLQRKEQQGRNKLQAAFKEIRKLGNGYKVKLATKAKVMKSKIAETQNLSYAKAAADIKRQLVKNIESKAKALRAAVTRLEKKSISTISKNLAKKSKKNNKATLVKKRVAKKKK